MIIIIKVKWEFSNCVNKKSYPYWVHEIQNQVNLQCSEYNQSKQQF